MQGEEQVVYENVDNEDNNSGNSADDVGSINTNNLQDLVRESQEKHNNNMRVG